MHLKIKKGLDIPILAKPQGELKNLPLPKTLALDLDPFDIRFDLLKKPGEHVQVGELLAKSKSNPNLNFVSPASGQLKEIVRGHKRRILRLIIDCEAEQTFYEYPPCKEELLIYLLKYGMGPHIRTYPCQRLPSKPPASIFVKALESAPFTPSPELEVEGSESYFQVGLTTLASLAPVHLVHRHQSTCPAFTNAKDVQIHTAEGPHPISNPSLHIAQIDPLKSQTIWSLTVHDVIAIGVLLKDRRYYNQRIISIAGEGIPESHRGFYRALRGFPIRDLLPNSPLTNVRLLSGDPLMGTEVDAEDYLHFFDTVFCALPQPTEKRRLFHFMRLCSKAYTKTATYLNKRKNYSFTTNQHGDVRAFIDGLPYEAVTPLPISTIHLIKAILSEDYELAASLGLLTVAPEDFALPAFVCPSKIEMPDIVKQGLRTYASQYLEV